MIRKVSASKTWSTVHSTQGLREKKHYSRIFGFHKMFLVGISGKSTVLGGAGEHESHSSCRPLGEEGEEAHESEREGKIPLQKFVKVTVVVPPSSGSGRRRKWR